MQTFLPYPSFRNSAACLDTKRLGKQRVETKQLLLALGVPVGQHQPKKTAWANHPAAKIWKGHEYHLAAYGMVVCVEWRSRGYKDSLLEQFAVLTNRLFDQQCKPPWLGSYDFHASHRSNLLRKDAVWYSRFGWAEPDDLPYVWPISKEVMA
jgi:hypothetical protein